jgi:hypothetical protein
MSLNWAPSILSSAFITHPKSDLQLIAIPATSPRHRLLETVLGSAYLQADHDRPWVRLLNRRREVELDRGVAVLSGEVRTESVGYGCLNAEEIGWGQMALIERGFGPLGTSDSDPQGSWVDRSQRDDKRGDKYIFDNSSTD